MKSLYKSLFMDQIIYAYHIRKLIVKIIIKKYQLANQFN